jgi:hypothetical protein
MRDMDGSRYRENGQGQPYGKRQQPPIQNPGGKPVNGHAGLAVFPQLVKRRGPDEPAQRRRHDAEPGNLRQLRGRGKLLEPGFEAYAIAKPQQHLSAQQKHARFVQHVFYRIAEFHHLYLFKLCCIRRRSGAGLQGKS